MSVHIRAQDVACNIRKCKVSGVDSFTNSPFALMLRLTFSITSTKASFFLYRTSARLQLIAPVAWVVILDDSSCRKGWLYSTFKSEGYIPLLLMLRLYSLS